MLEATGNLWDYPADAYVITTNGFVKKNGRAVMGAGVAKQARDTYFGIDYILGQHIAKDGNIPFVLGEVSLRPGGGKLSNSPAYIISMPVKYNWWENANLELIEFSARKLLDLVKDLNIIATVPPGCGNGRLNWEDIKPILESIWDDRFVVVNYV